MYLVTLSLHDDRLTDKSHLMTKVEKLQSFDITSMHSEFEVEPAQNIANDDGAREIERRLDWVGIFVPEKGGSFEKHLYKYKDSKSLCNESILAAFLTTSNDDVEYLVFRLLEAAEHHTIDNLQHLHEWSDEGYGDRGNIEFAPKNLLMSYYAIDFYD